MLLKLNSSGNAVRSVQEMLGLLGFREKVSGSSDQYRSLNADGIFGPATESVVIDFQRSEGLLSDGIIGPSTMKALEAAYSQRVLELNSPGVDAVSGHPDRYVFERVPADQFNGEGYERLSLRQDIASDYIKVYDAVHVAGGLMTSSGGIRSIQANVTQSRSATSFHYLGRALDLYIYSGMVDPEKDAYVVERIEARKYRIHARCSAHWNPDAELPPETTINNAITYKDRTVGASVTGHFLNLTELFKKNRFKPIRARRRFEEGASMMGAEWWHFQNEHGLTENNSTFGQELLKVYSEATLRGTPPWTNRDRVFGINWS